jgi:ABC-2 type transport system ATP-binding protein
MSHVRPVVEVVDLVKIFHDFWRRPKVRAVDGISLDIVPGEVFGLLGPNGSGKSTTIKILLGLLHASGGTVTVLGRPPRDTRSKSRVGYLPEASYLYQYLTPRETLDFYGSLFDLDRRTRLERTEALLDMVGLTSAGDRAVGEFSKGMARRVGLAQALINDPDLIILDEPTAGLDPIGCRQVKDLIMALARRGKTVILSSHLLADVEDVCDRVAILYNGQIRARGSVQALLREQDRVRFSMPQLPPDRLREVLQTLREVVGSEPDMDHPSMNLERFFLQVVEDAHENTAHPSGASRGTGLPSFLAGAGEA